MSKNSSNTEILWTFIFKYGHFDIRFNFPHIAFDFDYFESIDLIQSNLNRISIDLFEKFFSGRKSSPQNGMNVITGVVRVGDR